MRFVSVWSWARSPQGAFDACKLPSDAGAMIVKRCCDMALQCQQICNIVCETQSFAFAFAVALAFAFVLAVAHITQSCVRECAHVYSMRRVGLSRPLTLSPGWCWPTGIGA